MTETFSTTVRSRDCVACEMNVTASMGTSVTPNFLAVNDIATHVKNVMLKNFYLVLTDSTLLHNRYRKYFCFFFFKEFYDNEIP